MIPGTSSDPDRSLAEYNSLLSARELERAVAGNDMSLANGLRHIPRSEPETTVFVGLGLSGVGSGARIHFFLTLTLSRRHARHDHHNNAGDRGEGSLDDESRSNSASCRACCAKPQSKNHLDISCRGGLEFLASSVAQ